LATCGKGHNNWSRWVSTDGTSHKYCKSCRQLRAEKYTMRKSLSIRDHTDAEFRIKLATYDRCPICGRLWKDVPFSKGKAKYKITEDHIIPLVEGGTNDITNIQPLCYQCNFKKGRSY